MKSIKKNKLSLSKETLAPLTGNDLDGVAGGQSLGGLSQQISNITLRTAICSSGPATLACPTLRCFGGSNNAQ
jgi:hypothetical protein